jgi:predicted NBD/HSP70 family sugar kinase
MNKIASNTIRIKQLNVELVKDALMELTCATKLAIAKETGLSVATCGNILNELLKRGEVIELDAEEPNGGRPAKRFMYNANYCYVACIYMSYEKGVSRLTYAVVNLIGEIIEEDSVTIDVISYESIDELIERLLAKYGIIKAIGIGVPGAVYEGVVLDNCDIKELRNLPLGEQLKEKYSIEVVVENDMNLTALGFYKKQNYDEDKNIAIINFPEDNCIGSGIIVDGHIIKGNTNFAGEVSYLPINTSNHDLSKWLNINNNRFLATVVRTIVSVIAIINPDTIVLTGELISKDILEDTYNGCLKIIPKEHIPKIIIRENTHDDYMNGLVSVTIESLTCDVQLVKKRI